MPAITSLPPNASSAEVHFSDFRFHPWANATHYVRINQGPWETASNPSHYRISGLGWGTSEISVRASWAGLESVTTTQLFRLRPWWARWPALTCHALSLGGVVYGSVPWRTRQLERKAAELEEVILSRTAELRQAQKAREEFFSTLSHEIRNPLNGVVGICDLLSENQEIAAVSGAARYVRTLKDCSEQLRSMLDDVLDFSRIDRGDIQLNVESFELGSITRGAVLAVDVGMEHCSIALPENSLWLRGDCGKVRQIIINLVSNALKHGSPSTAQIAVAAKATLENACEITISVTNSGPAIPPDECERIFDGFSRGKVAIQRRLPGTGIGLSISRKLARAMGGDLSVRSDDRLTAFTLRLTLPVTDPAETAVPEPTNGTLRRALAVEDEEYNRMVLEPLFQKLGFTIDWAIDGASALRCASSGKRYDFVFLDMMLPDTTGVELAPKILATLPEPKPPLIAITAYSTPDWIKEAQEAGISGLVTKPVSLKKLMEEIVLAESAASPAGSPDSASAGAIEKPDAFGAALDHEGVAAPSRYDFDSILRLKNGPEKLAEFALSLPERWGEIVAILEMGVLSEPNLVRAVHALRSLVLCFRHQELGQLLGNLEDATRQNHPENALAIASRLGPLLADLAKAARQEASKAKETSVVL